jgi:hypothetical protein
MLRSTVSGRAGIVGTLIAALAFAGISSTALAAVTWHSGPTFALTYTNGVATGATASGDGSGFGNQPAVATITVAATVSYTCQNQGGNTAPGRNPAGETSSGSQDLGNASHNGRGVINLSVSFTPAATVPGKAVGCPNGNWTGIDPVFNGITSATLIITQGKTTVYGPVTLIP